MPEHVCVVLIKKNVVNKCFLFSGEKDTIAAEAQEKMIDLLSESVGNWMDEYTLDEVEVILDNGYYEWGNNSVCITWPEISGDN